MYRIYMNILRSFPGDFKILVKMIYFKRILWLISWSLQDDQGGSKTVLMKVHIILTFFMDNFEKCHCIIPATASSSRLEFTQKAHDIVTSH